jgi:hypothetical protein
MVNKSLKVDQKQRVEKVTALASQFLEQNNTHKAYQHLQSWYKPKAGTNQQKQEQRI